MMDFRELAKQVNDEVIAFRHDLHMHPEASMQEFRTTDRIAEELDKLGIPYRRFEPTGLIGTIEGGKPGKTIALRADIDALSITEKTDLPFQSQNEGFMHACGHDTHAAMLLGAAKVLNSIKDELPGTVRLLFQPAEELACGAKTVIKQGALDGIDFIFGIHIAGQAPVGCIAYCPGASASAADMFKITVTGKTVAENLEGVVNRDPEIIRPIGNPYSKTGGIAVLRGCRGAVEQVVADYLAGRLADSGEGCHAHTCADHAPKEA